jgi:hypothetical protein
MKVEIYPKEGLFKKQHPVRECSLLLSATEDLGWGLFMISPEKWATAYGIMKVLPLEKRMEKSRLYLKSAKKKLEEAGV